MMERSTYEQMFSAYLAYLGIPNMERITQAEIEKIQDEGESNWYQRVMKADERQMAAYYEKKNQWFEGDRFILHPDLYKKQIAKFLSEELPEILATYVRGQFRGSTERITKSRIKEVLASMLQENPVWWHSSNRKRIYLDKFKTVYPLCCDGVKPQKDTQQSHPIKSNLPPKKSNAKTKQKGSLQGLLILILIIWILYKIFT